MSQFPFVKQLDVMDCGPACLSMVANYYGKSYSPQTLRERSYFTREGVSMLGISDAAESIGMRTMGVRLSFDKLVKEVLLPCIAHWKQKHYKGFVTYNDINLKIKLSFVLLIEMLLKKIGK
jgi:ATP-binding cassette subfamily B protein